MELSMNELLDKYEKWFHVNAHDLDEDGSYSWGPFTVGFAVGHGFSLEDARQFAVAAFHKGLYLVESSSL